MSLTLKQHLDNACNSVRSEIETGKVADYIPALAAIDGNKLGAAIVTIDGEMVCYGDALEPFSIQSISKVHSLAFALNNVGGELWKRISYEPSGNAFNSIVQLEIEKGIPRNPFINAGAIAVCDLLLRGHTAESCIANLLKNIQLLSQDTSIQIDTNVAQSELDCSYRNRSLANFMKSYKNIDHAVDDVLEAYCHQCAISMNCEQIARSFLYLANEGIDPASGKQIVSNLRARRINSVMMMCGHYDASGEFAFRVGLPGKSGVGGGIVTIVPKVGVVAVWSPRLNEKGNSHTGMEALEAIMQSTGWNIL